MISRNTWILLGVLVVLIGAVFFIPWYQGQQPKPTPTASPEAAKPIFASPEVVQFTVLSKDGKKVVVKSAANNTWTVTEPTNLTYDASTVQTAAQFFSTGMIQTELPTQPPANAIGITTPEDTITVQMKDGSQKVMKVGSATPTGDGYYVQVDNGPAFTVSKTDLTNVLTLLTAGTPPVTPSASAPGTGIPGTPENLPAQSTPNVSPTTP